MNAAPPVSAIMPVPDEERHPRAAVRHIPEREHDGETEVVIAPGPSTDRTDEIAAEPVRETPGPHRARPTGRTPAALDAATEASRRPIVVRADGHGTLSPNHIATAVRLLEGTGATGTVRARSNARRRPGPSPRGARPPPSHAGERVSSSRPTCRPSTRPCTPPCRWRPPAGRRPCPGSSRRWCPRASPRPRSARCPRRRRPRGRWTAAARAPSPRTRRRPGPGRPRPSGRR
ncbi:glycosyltransferase [Streptomyces hydrogenans]|uniref:glycosyltransferase n=1 Tax=Streptomyces hydrogenans TaxID=1873719 RepID=UPI003827036A